MQEFFYRAKDNNKIITNYIRAKNLADAARRLENRGLVILEIKEEESKSENYAETIRNSSSSVARNVVFSLKEKKEFFNSFYFLYSSGSSIIDIFRSMGNSSHNGKIKVLCYQILKKVETGKSLKEAMSSYTSALGLAYTMLVVAGEASGKLDNVLSNVIKNINKEEELRDNIIKALTYPALMFAMALAVYLFFNLGILRVFSRMTEGITLEQTITIMLTAVLQIIVIFAFIIGFIIYVYKNKTLYMRVLNFLSRRKFVMKLLKNFYFANFFSVLSLSFAAGIPAAEAVELGNSVINIPLINQKIKKAQEMILNGCNVTTAFGITNVFSGYAMSQIASGENAGELEQMFKNIALDYERNLDLAVGVILKMIGPIFLIIVGIMVGFILIQGYSGFYGGLLGM